MCTPSFLLSCLPRLELPGIQDGSAGTLHTCLFEVLIITIKSFLRLEMDLVILKRYGGLPRNEVNPQISSAWLPTQISSSPSPVVTAGSSASWAAFLLVFSWEQGSCT